MRNFYVLAAWAAVLDGLSKWWALWYAPFVIYNTETTRFGMSMVMTSVVTMVLMFALAHTVSSHKDKVTNLLPAGALVFGGSLANFVSVFTGPPGVLDFIPFGSHTVGNLADIWIFAGCLWVWYVVGRAVVMARRSTREL